MMDFYGDEEWESFLDKLSEIIRTLLSINPFENNQELKQECEEVLLFLDKKDKTQSKKYSDLIDKLWRFFIDNKIFIRPKLP